MYSAFNGKEAIDLLQSYCINLANMPDIILLDLNMPVMDGIQFLKDVNTVECLDTNKLTLVMISSSIDPREIEEAKALGIKYFFSKPVSQSMIEDIFRQDC
jgi:CheY-like chemotaxis protein